MTYKPKVLNALSGGTGISNADASTITLGGSLTTSGSFASTFTMTNTTAVTFPTSGTLATTAQIPSTPISLANGGTNASLVASNGGILYSTATAGAILSGTATARQMLQSGASTTPAWSTATYPATTTAFQLLASTATSVVGEITAGSTGTVLTGVTGAVPAFSATPTLTSVTLGGGTALGTYIQGTFTPVLRFGGASVGITYSSQFGQYNQVGNVVYFSIQIILTSKGSSTGTASISGFPVTSSSTSGNVSFPIPFMYKITLTATYTQMYSAVGNSSVICTLAQANAIGSASVVVDNTSFANDSVIGFQGFYFTS